MNLLRHVRDYFLGRRIAKLEAEVDSIANHLREMTDQTSRPAYAQMQGRLLDLRSQLQLARARSKA